MEAKINKYGVGAFNIVSINSLKPIIEAAIEEQSPLILAVSPTVIDYYGAETIYKLIKITTKGAKIPIVLHLDHGRTLDDCIQSIRYGYSSVMFDGSNLPIGQNIAQTKEIVKFAHVTGVSVEAELGRIGGSEGYKSVNEREAGYTDPSECVRFVDETGIDALAIAIGTSHGTCKFNGKANLDFERLRKIENLIKIPLVLHGASGVPKEIIDIAIKCGVNIPGASGIPDEDIKKAISLGITKINIATDLRLAMIVSLRQEIMEHPDQVDPIKLLDPVHAAIKKVVAKKMKLFGSSGKA